MEKEATQTNARNSLFITASEAAEILGVSRPSITRMCRDGQITAVKVRRDWRINAEAFRAQFGI